MDFEETARRKPSLLLILVSSFVLLAIVLLVHHLIRHSDRKPVDYRHDVPHPTTELVVPSGLHGMVILPVSRAEGHLSA